MTVFQGQNYGDSTKTSNCQVTVQAGRRDVEHRRCIGLWKILYDTVMVDSWQTQ
jgi:hypothetical protein